MTTWKAVERKLAGRLGGQRVPITGRARGSAPDIQHAVYAIEVKHRRVLPNWIRTALAQAEASKRAPQTLAIAILHECGTRHDRDLVVLSLKDFEDFNGPVGVEAEAVVEDDDAVRE